MDNFVSKYICLPLNSVCATMVFVSLSVDVLLSLRSLISFLQLFANIIELTIVVYLVIETDVCVHLLIYINNRWLVFSESV